MEKRGKLNRISPQLAVFRALDEICDLFYREFKERADLEQTWKDIAKLLANAAPSEDDSGEFVNGISHLKPHWREYREVNLREFDGLVQRISELQSHKFSRTDTNEAWRQICEGNAPAIAKKIWNGSRAPRGSAHAMAERSDVSLKDFIFWMTVFRDHGLMEEFIRPGLYNEPLYLRAAVPDTSKYGVQRKAIQLLTS